MKLIRYDDVHAFYRQVEPFLLAHEAENNLIIGLCRELVSGSSRYPLPPYMAVVMQGEQVAAVAFRTPPHNLILAHPAAPQAIDLIVNDAAGVDQALTGVNGPAEYSEAFARRWQQHTGKDYSLEMKQRIYKLETVKPTNGVSGGMRPATWDDYALLKAWVIAFHIEAVGTSSQDIDDEQINKTIEMVLESEEKGHFLWVNENTVVSLAGIAGVSINGVRVGPVYTPPEHRRRGYAGALVAALSQHMLDRGCKFCFLYTDVANPTANHVYQNIGYNPVCDITLYRFR